MASKVSWVLAAVLLVAVVVTSVLWRSAETKREQAEAEKAGALASLKDARDAAEKAVAARQESEAVRAKTATELDAAKSELSVVKVQAEELKSQLPLLKEDATQARRLLAEVQRQNPQNVTPPTAIQKPNLTPKHNTGGWTVAEMLPPETLGVMTVRDFPITYAKAKETGAWKIITSPDFERVFKLPLGRVQGYMMMGEVMMGEKFSDIGQLFSQGEITFSVLGVDKLGPNGVPFPDVLLAIQLRDKAEVFLGEFNKRLDQLKAATNNVLTVTQTVLGNAKITRLTHPQMPAAVNCAMTDDTFLMCVGEGRLEKLLAMREASKIPGGNSAGKAPEVLAQVPAYKRALEKAGPDADVIVYANLQAIEANPMINAREMTPTQKHDLEMSGLKSVDAVSYSAGIKDTGVRESIFMDAPAAKRTGLLGLIDGESADMKSLYGAPRNAVFAGVFKITPEKLLDKAVELIALDNPKAREDIAAGLFFLGETLKIDVKKDLINALTGQGSFALSVPAKNKKLALAFPLPVVSMQVRNKEGLKTLISALIVGAAERVKASEITDGGKTITTVRQTVAEDGRDPGQISFAMDGDELLLSIYPLALREELKRRSSDSQRLEQDPDFNLARSNLTMQPQMMLYVDSAALGTAAYDLIAPIAQLRERNPDVNLNALPTGEIFNQNLGSALFGLQFAADGIYMEGFSATGMGLALVPLGVLAPRMAQRGFGGGLGAGGRPGNGNGAAAVQAFGLPKVEEKKLDTLGKIYRGLKEYAAEHGGNFPAKLDEMKPKYLQDIGNELEQVVYRGKQNADNLILAHTSEKLPGPIAVLLQNGNIQTILRQRLGKALKDGVTAKDAPDARQQPQQQTTPVKPPKVPDF